MTIPGPVVLTEDSVPPRGPNLRLSTPFLVGELEQGAEEPITIRSLRDLQRLCGARTADTVSMHDWVDAYFREGGSAAYVTPLRGPAAAAASHAFVDGSAATAITVTARQKGAVWNGAAGGLSADIDVSGSNFTVKIYLDAVLVETGSTLADGAAAATWADENSAYVTITDGVGGDPIATGSPANLTGGDDDFDGITNTEIGTALDRFTDDLGPGRVVLPGRTGTAAQILALTHAAERNRLACLDAVVGNSAAVLAHAATLRAADYADYGDLLTPRVSIPGLAAGGTRSVPSSALRCGCEARNDALNLSPNQPAAGEWGKARYATAVASAYTDDERGDLNDAGVTVVRSVDGDLKVYGSRTLADPDDAPAAIRIGSARLRMAIREIGRYRAEQTTFAEVDQGGIVLGELRGKIAADVKRYDRSLYALDITAELVEGDQQGTYVLEVVIEFQAAPDAEVVQVTIVRQVTEV